MSAFEDLAFSAEDFSGRVRLFPLPNMVLFPHVMQPLHVFESRYRELLEDALKDDQLIAMAVLSPGWEENYEGQPPLYPMACLGRVATHHRLEDGTYNLLLLGLRRVRLIRELSCSCRYRMGEVEVCDDFNPPQHATAQVAMQRQLRKAFLKMLPSLPEAQDQVDQLLGTDVSLAVLTDIISYMLDIDLRDKEALLAQLDVCRRAEMLLQHLTVAATDMSPGAAGQFSFPPQFSVN